MAGTEVAQAAPILGLPRVDCVPFVGVLEETRRPSKRYVSIPAVEHGHDIERAGCAQVSSSTQNQALSALLFLCRHVLGGELGNVIRARKPTRLPIVLTREEVKAVLSRLHGYRRLMASLMYGAGLRLMECLRLRVQDLDFARNEITVRDGKGAKDRVTMLPTSLKFLLQDHLRKIKALHERDLREGFGRVPLPDALERKYPNASSHWRWQWVFPQEHRWKNEKTGEQGRHHVDESIVQKAFKQAVEKAGLTKRATCHTVRHSVSPDEVFG